MFFKKLVHALILWYTTHIITQKKGILFQKRSVIMGKTEDVFSSRVKKLIIRRGKTITGVARAIGVDTSTFSRAINIVRRPSLEVLEKIAKELNVSVDYLLDRDLDEKKANLDEIFMIQRAYRNSPEDSKKYIVGMVEIMLEKIAAEKLQKEEQAK